MSIPQTLLAHLVSLIIVGYDCLRWGGIRWIRLLLAFYRGMPLTAAFFMVDGARPPWFSDESDIRIVYAAAAPSLSSLARCFSSKAYAVPCRISCSMIARVCGFCNRQVFN